MKQGITNPTAKKMPDYEGGMVQGSAKGTRVRKASPGGAVLHGPDPKSL